MDLREPTSEDLNDPRFEAIWQAIKRWDIRRDYSSLDRSIKSATGTDVVTILDQLKKLDNRDYPLPVAATIANLGG